MISRVYDSAHERVFRALKENALGIDEAGLRDTLCKANIWLLATGLRAAKRNGFFGN